MRHRFPRPISLLFLTALSLGFFVLPASAQPYELGEDDTWVIPPERAVEFDPGSPEGQLERARAALADGDARRAAFLAGEWIERHPEHPLKADAHLVRGDALLAQSSHYAALFDYEFVARTYTGSEAFVTALERELDIAQLFANGLKRKLWGMRIIDASEVAEELLIRIQERLPGSQLAESAGLALGKFYFDRQRMELAATMYEIFLENFPRSPEVQVARKRLIASRIASFKGPEFDASGLYEARTRLRTLIATNPMAAQRMGAEAILTRIDDSDARKLLSTARWYAKVNDPIAAELTLRRLLREYSTTAAARDAIRLGADLLPALPPGIRRTAPPYEELLDGRDTTAPESEDDA